MDVCASNGNQKRSSRSSGNWDNRLFYKEKVKEESRLESSTSIGGLGESVGYRATGSRTVGGTRAALGTNRWASRDQGRLINDANITLLRDK